MSVNNEKMKNVNKENLEIFASCVKASINAEAAARQSADTTLQQNIDSEEATRIAADT